jgi:hypothetical protein
VLCAKKKKKRVGASLTYDTALQVVSWTTQVNLFLDLLLLGRHFIGFFLLARVEATEERWEVGGGGKAEAGAGMERAKCRTSCGSIDDTKEK